MKFTLPEKHQVTLWQILRNVAETNKPNKLIYKNLVRLAEKFHPNRSEIQLKPRQVEAITTFTEMVQEMCDKVIKEDSSSKEQVQNAMARKELINEIRDQLPSTEAQNS